MMIRSGLQTILAAALAAALCSACATGNSAPQLTHDGLQLVPNSKMERAWVKPGEDFSQYSRVGLLDAYVAFKKDWQLNHPDMRMYDMNKIEVWLAGEFRKVFTAELVKNGYPIAISPAKDVLLVRPSIIDLEIVAPDSLSDESAITFATSVGSMELYVEFYDSISNEILARTVDRRQANQIAGVQIASFTTESDDVRRLLQHWAELLVGRLDEAHGKSRD